MKESSPAIILAFLASLSGWAVDDAISAAPVIQGRARAACVDAAGNRFVTGFFFGERDFNSAAGVVSKTSAGDADVFVSSIKADGTLIWVQTFGGSGDDEGAGIALSGDTVYVSGKFSSPNAGIGAAGTTASAGGDDAFVLALNAADGKPITTFGTGGVVTFGGTLDDQSTAVAIDGKIVYVAGHFSSPTATGSGATATQTGAQNGFVLALDATGKAVEKFGTKGVQTIGGAGIEGVGGLALSGKTLYVSGFTTASNTGIGGLGDLKNIGSFDALVAALDAKTGAAVTGFGKNGIQLIGGSNNDLASSVVAASDTIYVGGVISSVDAGIGALGSVSTTGDFDGFVAALDSSTGAAVSVFGNAGIAIFGGKQRDGIAALALADERVFAVGSFESADAGFGAVGTLRSAGSGDALIVALDRFSGAPGAGTLIFGGTFFDAAFGVARVGGKAVVAGEMASADGGVNGTGTANGIGFGGFLLEVDPALFLQGTEFTSADDDSDGFPGDLEAALFTDPFNVNSTPAGGAKANPKALTVSKLSIKLNFAVPNPQKDSISLSGTLALPSGMKLESKRVIVYAGGVARTFVLNAKGASPKSKTASLKIGAGKGGAKFSASLKAGAFRDFLDDENLVGTADIKSEMRSVVVGILIDADFYSAAVKLKFGAKKDKSGSASGPAK